MSVAFTGARWARSVGFGLRFGARLALAEEVKGPVAELAAQDAEGPRAVAEAAGDLVGGDLFDEIGARRLVLALGSRLGCQEEAGLLCWYVY